jgi:hypothetical protein
MYLQIWLHLSSTVVEHSNHNPMIEGTNPATGTLGEKFSKQCEQCHHIRHLTSFTKNRCGCAPVAEPWHLNPKIEGLNPATSIVEIKWQK